MSAGPIAVAKVGGSLLEWPRLPARLERWLSRTLERDEAPILIVGGGGVADWVRTMDRIHGLRDDEAHDLAVMSLDITARFIAARIPRGRPVSTPAQARDVQAAGGVPVLAPSAFLADDERRADSLPKSWDVTSDSIAARLARRVGAARLVLLKSATLPSGTSVDAAAEAGFVDPYFPTAARGLPWVGYCNLRWPDHEIRLPA